MLDNLPDIHAPESGSDDIPTPEKSDNLLDMHAHESGTDDHTLERSDISPDIHTPERSSTCNNKESILRKAKLIRNFGIASFSFIGIVILLYIIVLIVALSSIPSYPNNGLVSATFSMSIVILIFGAIFSIADFVFMILAIVNIATTD